MRIIFTLVLFAWSFTAHAQLKGGPCEGCEAVFEYGNKKLKAADTLPDYNLPGPKLKMTGIIYQHDGRTPAAGVILYIYHTNQAGLYVANTNETGWGKRHGTLRAWIKTGPDGRYTFYTLKPGTYPSRSEPAHIHATVLEPNGNYYYIEEWHFKGDPLLVKLRDRKLYGGEGVLNIQNGAVTRNIILGLNVPDYGIDTAHSFIYWKGTKLGGTGSHEGSLKISSGYMAPGGSFRIPLSTLQITDVPAHEPIPRANLTRHLKEEFEATQYPYITFTISAMTKTHVSGRLTVMQTTRPVTIPYRKTSGGYEAIFNLSRKAWGIGKKAGWLEDKLVDDSIRFRISLIDR
ncbi:YceI family protein [Mucilaginibacter calamicampi]|uniref:YceI family protein n=1 Tax=Mucilaginibacter calamicampi TaxID=1302352 RepID=A0ABW2YU48_9SPHI